MIRLAAGKLKLEHPQLSKKIHGTRKRAIAQSWLTSCRQCGSIPVAPSGCNSVGRVRGLGARDNFHLTAADNAEKRRKSVKNGENRRFESEPKCV